MTLKELSQCYKLRERLLKNEDMLRSLRETIAPGGQVLTGMPHAPGVKDKVGDLAVEIASLEQRIEKLKVELGKKEKAVETLIEAIPDDEYLQMVFRLRFIRCLTWGEVAAVIGGGNTENSVKSACYRYLKTCNGVTRRDA